jgi:hypothetical protein
VPIPSRKTPFALPASYRSYDEIELDYSDLIHVKGARPAKADTSATDHEVDTASSGETRGGMFREWDVWDYVVAIGVILLLIGLIIPIFSDRRELAIFAPVGAAAIGLGGFRARQRSAVPTQSY